MVGREGVQGQGYSIHSSPIALPPVPCSRLVSRWTVGIGVSPFSRSGRHPSRRHSPAARQKGFINASHGSTRSPSVLCDPGSAVGAQLWPGTSGGRHTAAERRPHREGPSPPAMYPAGSAAASCASALRPFPWAEHAPTPSHASPTRTQRLKSVEPEGFQSGLSSKSQFLSSQQLKCSCGTYNNSVQPVCAFGLCSHQAWEGRACINVPQFCFRYFTG